MINSNEANKMWFLFCESSEKKCMSSIPVIQKQTIEWVEGSKQEGRHCGKV